MSKVPEGVDPGELTVIARRVLLDGVTALIHQIDALTIVGAQAVHLRTSESPLRGASFTSDGDISIDPKRLGDEPLLQEALREAGFELMVPHQPGLWARTECVGGKSVPIELDLLVPERQAPTAGRRSAEMPPHHKMAARRVPGLEVASVDRSLMLVPSLEPRETRCVPVHVAGPVALFVAKAFKIRDRLTQGGDRDRLTDKDAGDVLRLMTAVPVMEAAASFSELCKEPDVGDIADEGAGLLGSLFGGRRTPGVDMAVRALAGDMPEQRVRALAPAYVAGLRQRRSPVL